MKDWERVSSLVGSWMADGAGMRSHRPHPFRLYPSRTYEHQHQTLLHLTHRPLTLPFPFHLSIPLLSSRIPTNAS